MARGNFYKPGYVYILKNSDGLYKIGLAKNVNVRVQKIRITENDWGIKIIKTYYTKSMRRFELSLHESFSSKRVRGEWFDLLPEDFDDIDLFYETEKLFLMTPEERKAYSERKQNG